MKHGPWTSGPRELLEHAKDHIARDSDVDNRFAMISVDNAVELMLKTYLILPKRVSGLALSRKEREEYTRNFIVAISAMEELAPDSISGVPLGEIEWFHRIRNRLYHEGTAITVEREQVQRYLKHAEKLMRSLFPAKPADGRRTRRRITSRNKQYQQFFDRLRSALLSVDPNFTRAKALPQNWWTLGLGRTGFYLEPWFTDDRTFRITITVGTKIKQQNDAAFEQLRRNRMVIEQQLGEELVWERLPDRRACRIYTAVDGTIDDDQEHLDQLIEWAAPTVIRFREVFGPRIKSVELKG